WNVTYNQDQAYTGWDSFYRTFDYNTETPDYINPAILGEAHPNYAIGQLKGLSDNQIRGTSLFDYKGKSYNLYNTNWVVHLTGRLLKNNDYDKNKIIENVILNFMETERSRREEKEFNIKKTKYDDKKIEDMEADARAEARANSYKQQSANENKKHVQEIQQNQALEEQKAQMKRKLMLQLFAQMSNKKKNSDSKD
ncbi:MAG: hypothetical protein ABIA63_09165, partial [bacterium]